MITNVLPWLQIFNVYCKSKNQNLLNSVTLSFYSNLLSIVAAVTVSVYAASSMSCQTSISKYLEMKHLVGLVE